MTWVRIDDRLHDHPKFRLAWKLDHASVGLELFALSHSAAFLTDGEVSRNFVGQILPRQKQRERAVSALVESGLWIPNGAGWQIHDYLDYNEPRVALMERRRKREETRQLNRWRLDESR